LSVPSLNLGILVGRLRLFAPYLLLIARRSVKKWSVSSGGDNPAVTGDQRIAIQTPLQFKIV
jgi:hypothetical protein